MQLFRTIMIVLLSMPGLNLTAPAYGENPPLNPAKLIELPDPFSIDGAVRVRQEYSDWFGHPQKLCQLRPLDKSSNKPFNPKDIQLF